MVTADSGLVVEDAATGFCGAVVSVSGGVVALEDFNGAVRNFPLGTGFLIDGKSVELVKPQPAAAKAQAGGLRSASGSRVVEDHTARIARPSRIFVEGRHDAELVEKVWGHDLRVEGIVVEFLGGIDDLPAIVQEFAPTPERRLGVLVDHLVAGSKESRIAETVSQGAGGEHVLVVGHPYVDVWQAIKPARLGMSEWPEVPRSIEWKHGICDHLGWPHADQSDIALAWQRILATVRSYVDLEPAFLGRVEQLIDFVTAPSVLGIVPIDGEPHPN